MNIYDTNESVELYDNRGIEMARKCIRRAKREDKIQQLSFGMKSEKYSYKKGK